MEIVVERIAKKNDYTIGRLYLLADGDVKRKALSGKTAGDKRSFEHSFDLKKLSKDSYFCDTMEPTWRNLKGIALKPGGLRHHTLNTLPDFHRIMFHPPRIRKNLSKLFLRHADNSASMAIFRLRLRMTVRIL